MVGGEAAHHRLLMLARRSGDVRTDGDRSIQEPHERQDTGLRRGVASLSTPDKVESRLGTLEFNDGAPSEATADAAVRPSRLHPRRAGVHRRVPRGVGGGDTTRVPLDRGRGQHDGDVLGADGLGVVVPDRQLRHLLLPRLRRPVGRADGDRRAAARGAVGDPRDDRRHVVPVGHRLRAARARPRRRAAGTCSSARATTARCPTAASTSRTRARPVRWCWAGRSWSTTTRASRPTRSARASGSRRTCPARRAPRSPRSSPGTRRSGPRRGARDALHRGSGTSFNTIPPNDYGFWETVNELIQHEPPPAATPRLLGMLAASGIVHGKPFEPDERMRKILEDAAVVGNATARTVTFAFRPEEGFALLPGLGLGTTCCGSAATSSSIRRRRSPPMASSPSPSDGARKLNSKIAFLYPATGVTPGDVHAPHRHRVAVPDRLAGGDGEYLDGGRNYRLTLPPDIPESRFWSAHALRPPDPVDAPDRPTPPRHRQPVGHGRDQRRRLDRHLLRTHRARRPRGELALRPPATAPPVWCRTYRPRRSSASSAGWT